MKKYTLLVIATLISSLALQGCSPKAKPRYEHEPKREWTPTAAPAEVAASSQEFNSFDIDRAYQILRHPEKSKAGMWTEIVKPLSRIVLNANYTENPAYRTTRLSQMVTVFNHALLTILREKPAYVSAQDLAKLKRDYVNTLFSGCSRDLRRDCMAEEVFQDNRTAPILVLIAGDSDSAIEAELKKSQSPRSCVETSETCRTLVEDRYRLLAMAHRASKANRTKDDDYAFAYLKYSRLYAFLMDYWRRQPQAGGRGRAEPTSLMTGYLSEVHGGIFETLIAQYKPKSFSDPEFRAFVENFNPWVYSNKQADLFRYGTRIMFEMAAQCCLYEDAARTKLNDSVKVAIAEAQEKGDDFGLSFSQIIRDIKKDGNEQVFKNLRIEDVLKKLEQDEGRRKNGGNPEFFNEYFFIIDRLFREHLESSEVKMVLDNTNQERALKQLPAIIQTYVKVYLAYMIVETNRFMSSIYHSDSIGSDEIFQEAILKSRDISGRWLKIQNRIEMLDKFLGSYFKGRNLLSEEYNETTRLLKSVNRNVHYLSVYPNMMVMTYYLAKMKGKITVRTWWGAAFEIPADTILDVFFDGGIQSVWFRFGNDPVLLSREMILYALHYMLSTNTLQTFVAKDDKGEGTNRSKFFDLIFTKYLDENIRQLGDKILEYERATIGHPGFANVDTLCAYETFRPGAGLPPKVQISLLELDRYTYSGAGANSVNLELGNLLGQSSTAAEMIRNEIDDRITYVHAMVDIIEADLLRTGQIKAKGDAHPDLKTVRAHLGTLEDLKRSLAKLYIRHHKRYFDCLMDLKEIEQRRMNRLYEEERAHLGKIYDLMEPLSKIQDEAALGQKVNEINTSYFRKEGSGYRFDRLDGRTYRMSKFDLLMRMKARVEADIFMQPTDREKTVYGQDLARLQRQRRVSVFSPPGLERDPIVETAQDAEVYLRDSKEEFIKQGMTLLNGKTNSFIQWHGQVTSETDLSTYLATLREYFLMGPVRVPKEDCRTQPCESEVLEVSARDLIDAYIRAVASLSLDEFDVQNAREFGVDGKKGKAYFEELLFEKDSYTRQPLFFSLMKSTVSDAKIKLDQAGPVQEALEFAQTINNLGVFLFEPWPEVKEAIRQRYGSRAHRVLNRINQLFVTMKEAEDGTKRVEDLSPRLKLPFYLQDGQPVYWLESGVPPMVDRQTIEDLRIRWDNFVQRTGNFYGTRPPSGR